MLCYLAETVNRVNQDPDWVLSALAPNRPVLKQVVAGFRIRPLVLEDYRVERAVAVVRGSKPFAILPFRPLKVGLVTTGKEIVDKRVEDAFRPKLLEKLERLGGGTLIGQRFCTDSLELISDAIGKFLDEDADVIICTGGMSVDADDKTPGAIRSRCRRIAFQGTPALPGAMLMLGYAKSPKDGRDVAVIGAPACVAFDDRTALDKLLPFVFAGIEPGDLVRRWGVGGLCEHCPVCHYPTCSFAAGS